MLKPSNTDMFDWEVVDYYDNDLSFVFFNNKVYPVNSCFLHKLLVSKT